MMPALTLDLVQYRRATPEETLRDYIWSHSARAAEWGERIAGWYWEACEGFEVPTRARVTPIVVAQLTDFLAQEFGATVTGAPMDWAALAASLVADVMEPL